MMKNIAATFLGFACLALVAQAAAPGPGYAPPTAGLGAPPAQQGMTAFQAWQILQSNGFLARPYYSGVPDPIAVRRVDNRARMRALLTAKLNTLVIPSIAAMNDFTMEEAIEALENIFKKADPAQEGFRMFINQFVDPGGVPLQNNGSGATSGPAGPGGQQNVDPTTGLPLGLGAPGGGAGGQPQIDPTTGLPINSGASGVGGAPPGGLPGVGGVPPGGAAPGLPGMAAPGAGAGGLPGLGGGGAMPGLGGGGGSSGQGAFDPTTVRVRGLKKELRNLTAKQVLDVVCMSLDTPIQYVVTDQGIMFLQQRQELWGTVTRKFQLNLNMRTLQMMGASVPKLTPPTNNGGGQGQGSGGGQGGFGQGPGGGQGGGGYGPGMGGPGMGGPGMGGPGMGGPGMGGPGVGGAPGGGTQFRVPGTTGGFGAGYRPFNLHRFNSGFAPSPFQPRQ